MIPFKGLREDWLYLGHAVIRPFAVVEFDFLTTRPEPPHTEDQAIHPSYRVYQRLLAPDRQERLLARIDDETVENIFGASIHHEHGWYVRQGEGTRSLGTIRPAAISDVIHSERSSGRRDYRILFNDGTDLTIQSGGY